MPLWKDKQSMAYLFDGLLYKNAKEWTNDTSLDVSQNWYIELKKTVTGLPWQSSG